MHEQEFTPEKPEQSGNVLALFLGLYLLILAFFILLVSISSVEKVKSEAVMDSLTSTFATLLPPTTSLTAFQSREGDVLANQRFQEQITQIFSTALQVVKVEIIQPGRQMQARMHADSLFFSDESRIRDSQYLLMDRIIAAISARPAGLRFDMEFLLGTGDEKGAALLPAETLEMRRGGAFMREMLSRGAPPESIAIGLLPGEQTQVVMKFHIRELDDSLMLYDGLKDGAQR